MDDLLTIHAKRILQRHHENQGGDYPTPGLKEALIKEAVAAGEATGLKFPLCRRAIEGPLYDFIRQYNRGDSFKQTVKEPELKVDKTKYPFNLKLPARSLQGLAIADLLSEESLLEYLDGGNDLAAINGIGKSSKSILKKYAKTLKESQETDGDSGRKEEGDKEEGPSEPED